MYFSFISLKLAPSGTSSVQQWFLKWAHECFMVVVSMYLSILMILYQDQLWTAKEGQTYIRGRYNQKGCIVCSSPIAVTSITWCNETSMTWLDQSLAEFCLSLWLMELISSFIDPAIILESSSSCDTSWITSFSSLALKRSLRMDLSGNCQWSEEQMIWMGEFQRCFPSTSGRLRNCWLFQAGLPESRSASSS